MNESESMAGEGPEDDEARTEDEETQAVSVAEVLPDDSDESEAGSDDPEDDDDAEGDDDDSDDDDSEADDSDDDDGSGDDDSEANGSDDDDGSGDDDADGSDDDGSGDDDADASDDDDESDDDADGSDDDEPAPGDDTEERPGLEKSVEVSEAQLKSVLESLIFVADKPVSVRQLARSVKSKSAEIRPLLAELVGEYEERGVQLVEVGGGFQFRSAVANAQFVRGFVARKPVRLTRAQLETLAIVSYRQPVTRPEVDEIRGVDSGSSLKVLLERGLLKVLGRKDEPGRPLLYGTSPSFLDFFGLKSLKELPTLKEFTELSDESRGIFQEKMGEEVDFSKVEEAAKAAEADAQEEFYADEEIDEDLEGEEEDEDLDGDESGEEDDDSESDSDDSSESDSDDSSESDSDDSSESDDDDDSESDDSESDDSESDDSESDDSDDDDPDDDDPESESDDDDDDEDSEDDDD